MKFNARFSFTDTLKAIQQEKSPVEIILNNGKNYTGTVQEVTETNLVISLKGERSFFDAMIRVSDISAIEVQVRKA